MPHDKDAALVVVPPAVAPVVVAVAGPTAHVGHPHIESPVTVTCSHMLTCSHMVIVTCQEVPG